MQLSCSEREAFYHGLAQTVRSGIGLQVALETLGAGSGNVAHAARTLAVDVSGGLSPAMQAAGFPELDVALISAGESSGRSEQALQSLAMHYQHVSASRRRLMAGSAYPVFVLHLGAVLLSLPRAVLLSDAGTFISGVLAFLLPVYVLAGVAFVTLRALRILSARNEIADRLIRSIPIVGAFFKCASSERFSLVLSMGLRTSGGLLKTLSLAGRSCGSASMQVASDRAVVMIKEGSAFADAMQSTHAFPGDMIDSLRVGELSGRLDEESSRLAARYSERLSLLLSQISVWVPRLLYLLICLIIGYQILSLAGELSNQFSSVLETN